jgi:hypothetical protein
MDLKSAAAVVRLAMALTVVATMIVTGWLHRSPWVVLLATPVFTALYTLGTSGWLRGGLPVQNELRSQR